MYSFLLGINVVYENSDYFLAHDIAPIPHELVMRLGDLSGATFISGTIKAMNFIQRQILNTKRYYHVMTDGVMRLMVPLVVEKVRSGVTFRI